MSNLDAAPDILSDFVLLGLKVSALTFFANVLSVFSDFDFNVLSSDIALSPAKVIAKPEACTFLLAAPNESCSRSSFPYSRACISILPASPRTPIIFAFASISDTADVPDITALILSDVVPNVDALAERSEPACVALILDILLVFDVSDTPASPEPVPTSALFEPASFPASIPPPPATAPPPASNAPALFNEFIVFAAEFTV